MVGEVRLLRYRERLEAMKFAHLEKEKNKKKMIVTSKFLNQFNDARATTQFESC